MKQKVRVPKELYRFVNCHAGSDKHPEYTKDNILTQWGLGYNQAVIDIFERIFCPDAYPLRDNEDGRGFTD